MAKCKITVLQVFRLTRAIDLEVEADGMDKALDMYAEGGIDNPPADDPRWQTTRMMLEDEWAEER